MARRKAPPGTVTSTAPATTRRSCSSSAATWNAASSAPATCTTQKVGRRFWGRSWPATPTQNEVRLQLHALAYNLGIFLSRADLPDEVASWSLTSLQTRLIKIGARVVRHARSITFQLAEIAIPGDLFRRILAVIHRLRPSPAPT